MDADETRMAHGQLIAGLVVVAAGLVLLTFRVSGFGIDGWWSLWPLIVIAVGVGQLADSEHRQRRGGLPVVVVGIWLLFNSTGLFGFTYGESWPALLVGLGLARLLFPQARGRAPGLLLLAVGLWFSLQQFEVPGIDFDKLWPILIVLAGIFIVWRAFVPQAECCGIDEASDHVAR